MATAVIVDAVRTAGGKRNGKLSGWHPADLAAEMLKALAERNDLDPALVEDVIMGCVMQVGNQSLNVGRNAVLAAGWPETVPATTIDRQCGSSQQSAHFAAQGVMAGAYDIVVAAGVEVMSTTPMGASVTPGTLPLRPQGHGALRRRRAAWSCPRASRPRSSPTSGTSPARTSTPSPSRASSAPPRPRDEGRFDNEIIPVAEKRLDQETGEVIETDEMVTADEGIRPTPPSRRLAKLKPAFKPGRQGHRRQLLADHRRRLGRADHERGEGQGARPHAPGPLPHLRRWPASTRSTMLTGPIPATAEGARARPGLTHRRHRPLRDQRGLRLGRAGLGEGATSPT